MSSSSNSDSENDGELERVPVPSEFFTYRGEAKKDGNSLYKCLHCAVGPNKTISCSDRSRLNLKKHIKSAHAGLLASFEMACDALSDRKLMKRKAANNTALSGPNTTEKQMRIEHCLTPPLLTTQERLDNCIMDYLIDSVLPIHHISNDSFVTFINRLTSGRFRPRCRQTATKQLEERFVTKKSELKQLLSTVDVVCTTADCWSSRRRSFLGMTIHWLDKTTLERKGACLAVRQIFGRHTYDVIANVICGVHKDFGIDKKVSCTVTDSGSNFLKAFRHFAEEIDGSGGADGVPDQQPVVDDENRDDGDDEFEAFPIEEILQQGPEQSTVTAAFGEQTAGSPGFSGLLGTCNNDVALEEELMNEAASSQPNEEVEQIILPPHRKCACHLLNLVATTDVQRHMSGTVKKISVQTFSKLTALWNKQNRTTLAAERIKSAFGSMLITPGETRWNSYYDAVSKVNDILSKPEQAAEFDKVCDDLEIKKLLPIHKRFVAEYVRFFKPVCVGLDVLQGDKHVGFGYLLPTLTTMLAKLQMLLDRNLGTNANPLTICEPLVHALKAGIQQRFADVFTSDDAKLAAVVTPKFKLDWIDHESEKAYVTTLLESRVATASASLSSCATTSAQASVKPDTPDDFFSDLAARRKRLHSLDHQSSVVSVYINDASDSISSLSQYPSIKQLHLLLNSSLPASAAVERLFSLGGKVFSPLRTRMTSEHFEMLVFLRSARF